MKSHALVLKGNCSLSCVVPEYIHSRVNLKIPSLHFRDYTCKINIQ